MKKYKKVFVLLTAIYSLLPTILLAQWTQATVNTASPARYNHTLIANDNKTWEMEGWNGSSLGNNVWNSIGLTEPAIPTLVSPLNNSVTNNKIPTFIWNSVPGAVAYDLRLDQRIGDVPMPWTTWEIESGVSAHATIRYSPDYTYPVTITPWVTTLPYVIPLDTLTWDATEILPWVSRDPIVLFPGDSTKLGMWLTATDSSALIRYLVVDIVGDTVIKSIGQVKVVEENWPPPEWNKSSITYKAPVDSSMKKANNFELFIECSGLTRDNVETSQGSEDTVEKTTFVLTPGPGTKGVQITWRFKEIATGNKKKFGVKFKRPANQKAMVNEGVWTRNGMPTEPPKHKSRLGKESITDTTWTPTEPLEDGTYYWTVHAQDDLGNWSEFATPWTFTTVTLQTFTISGYVSTSAGTGISEAMMNGLPGNPNTEANGFYTGTVDYGWSGTVTPTKSGYTFSPTSQSYSNVTSDQTTDYVGTGPTSVKQISQIIQDHFALSQNYPNPFNPSTVIRFSLPQYEFVQLKVFDLLGKEVISLVSESLDAGSYEVKWNASSISSGIYIYQIKAGQYIDSKKIILLK